MKTINEILDSGVLGGDESTQTLQEVLERSELQINWLLDSNGNLGALKDAALERLSRLNEEIEKKLNARQGIGLDGMTPVHP